MSKNYGVGDRVFVYLYSQYGQITKIRKDTNNCDIVHVTLDNRCFSDKGIFHGDLLCRSCEFRVVNE